MVYEQNINKSFTSEMGEFIIFWCEVSSGYCTLKIIEIDSVFTQVIQNIKMGMFLRHSVYIRHTSLLVNIVIKHEQDAQRKKVK